MKCYSTLRKFSHLNKSPVDRRSESHGPTGPRSNCCQAGAWHVSKERTTEDAATYTLLSHVATCTAVLQCGPQKPWSSEQPSRSALYTIKLWNLILLIDNVEYLYSSLLVNRVQIQNKLKDLQNVYIKATDKGNYTIKKWQRELQL